MAASLVLLVEPGLKDLEGREQKTRQRLLFSYKFSCDSATAPDIFTSGVYYFVVNVDKPIPTQIQLFAQLTVDPVTGQVTASFVNADRNPDKTRCTPACDAATTCQTPLAAPSCATTWATPLTKRALSVPTCTRAPSRLPRPSAPGRRLW